MRALHARLNAVAISFGVAVFVGLEAAAMALYPGGTWWNANAVGHRFWENYLCDLEWSIALNGRPNPEGSRLAEAAMIVLLLALGSFWSAVPLLFAARRRLPGRLVRGLGLVSVAATVAVVFMPSERFGALHGAMVVFACVPGLVATAMAVRELAIGEPRPPVATALGGMMLASAAVDFALYVLHLVGHREGTPLVPALEKVTALLLLAWMLTVAARTRSPRAPRPG